MFQKFTEVKDKGLGTLWGGLFWSGACAASGAISGSSGTGIMSLMPSSNHTSHDITKAAEIGAIGGSLIGLILGAVAGMYSGFSNGSVLSCFNILSTSKKCQLNSVTLKHLLNSNVAYLIGYGILLAASEEMGMSIGETAFAFLVGSIGSGAIIAITEWLGLDCMCNILGVFADVLGESTPLMSSHHSYNSV